MMSAVQVGDSMAAASQQLHPLNISASAGTSTQPQQQAPVGGHHRANSRIPPGIHNPPPEHEPWREIAAPTSQIIDARPILPIAAFFMGDLRDGLPMLNMQAAFLISCRNFNEKQVGILFFVFGMSQFLCMAPAGYFLDYSNNKIDWVLISGVGAAILTVLTAVTAEENGRNMALMILWRILQGGITAILPPGFNGITLGIVGSTGFTFQVSRNRMMNHIGTALVVALGSLIAYFLYPNIGALFIVSPLAAIGMAYNLRRIKPTHVDRDAARGLIIESPTMNEYEQYDDDVALQALSWQMMEDERTDKQPPPISSSFCGSENDADILSSFSNPTNSMNNNLQIHTGSSIVAATSSATLTCPYEKFSHCGTRACIGSSAEATTTAATADAARNLPSPADSATSSAYMPPDILDSNLGSPLQAEAKPDDMINSFRNSTVLNSPIMEDEEHGFDFVNIQLDHQQLHDVNNNSPRLRHNAQPQHTPQSNPAHHLGRQRPEDTARGGGRSIITCDSGPSYNMGYGPSQHTSNNNLDTMQAEPQNGPDRQGGSVQKQSSYPIQRKARTPLAVLMDRNFIIFTVIIFFFHVSNSSVLPLVMQSLALRDPQAGILLSGLCIVIAQAFMSFFAKVCGDYSPIWGRKKLFLVGLSSLTARCFLLMGLVSAELEFAPQGGSNVLKGMILSTQLLDAVGAGIIGCLHIIVTSDISGGTGRFSLMLGVTTAAMCLGGTVSGYLGQAIAQDYGYPFAFTSLGIMSLVPFTLYLFFMPETLPDYARSTGQTFQKRRKRLAAIFKRLSEHRRRLVAKANPFLRRDNNSTGSNVAAVGDTKPAEVQLDRIGDNPQVQTNQESEPHSESVAQATKTTPLVETSHVELV